MSITSASLQYKSNSDLYYYCYTVTTSSINSGGCCLFTQGIVEMHKMCNAEVMWLTRAPSGDTLAWPVVVLHPNSS